MAPPIATTLKIIFFLYLGNCFGSELSFDMHQNRNPLFDLPATTVSVAVDEELVDDDDEDVRRSICSCLGLS